MVHRHHDYEKGTDSMNDSNLLNGGQVILAMP